MVEFIITCIAVAGLGFSLIALIGLSIEFIQYGGLVQKASEGRIVKGGWEFYAPFVFVGALLVVSAAVLAG